MSCNAICNIKIKCYSTGIVNFYQTYDYIWYFWMCFPMYHQYTRTLFEKCVSAAIANFAAVYCSKFNCRNQSFVEQVWWTHQWPVSWLYITSFFGWHVGESGHWTCIKSRQRLAQRTHCNQIANRWCQRRAALPPFAYYTAHDDLDASLVQHAVARAPQHHRHS